MADLSFFANPHRFMKLSAVLMPVCAVLGVILIAGGWYWGLTFAPEERYQRDAARIIFVHVPAAWMGMGAFAFMALASLVSLIWRHNLADLAARTAALPGAVFTFICLSTGSIWGYPIWNTWWEWQDARLTSMLLNLFIYIAYMAVWKLVDNPSQAARAAAILCLVGALNLPIIKFSVDIWSTMHQTASVLRAGGPAMPMSYLAPLLTAALGYFLLFNALVMAGMRSLIFRQRAQAIYFKKLLQVEQG